jgi:hypothetical protein
MEASGQFHDLATLPEEKESSVLIEQESGWTPEWSGCFGEQKKILAPAGN